MEDWTEKTAVIADPTAEHNGHSVLRTHLHIHQGMEWIVTEEAELGVTKESLSHYWSLRQQKGKVLQSLG
jgi:hypothetical protein